MELNKDKLPIIFEAMNKNDADAWIIMGRETIMKSEPVLPVLGDLSFIIATTLVFTRDKCIAIVSPLDVEAYKTIEGIDEVREYPGTMEDTIYEVLSELGVKRLALNISSSDSAADGLTVGMYRRLQRVLDRLETKPEVISAFPIISEVRGRKTASQIELIRDCVVQADKYLRSLPEVCHEGMTSLEVFNYLQEVAFRDGYTMSWAESQCPSVSCDPNVPQGHSGLTDTPLVKGCTVNIDYGVKKNGYCSDLQRMYYVLKDDEEDAPEEVKKAFYLVRDAIDAARRFMMPGVTGFRVDQIARHMIVDEGFDSWNAALGHQVGHVTHDGGTILANRRPRYNKPELIDTPLQVGNVFTIEPGIEIPQGRIGIEEDVVLTEQGAEFLCPRQEELILIRLQ
ncbi:MAG: aminopeptidase P family protein [Oscillospiraceae bacterium]|nr:aminopeptidase P family protein [Oscillospiraceae bacterium]